MKSNYDIVKEACLKANPSKEKECTFAMADCDPEYDFVFKLADVLLAVVCKEDECVRKCGVRLNQKATYAEICSYWSLKNDSLSWHRDNKPEVIDFLANLLK